MTLATVDTQVMEYKGEQLIFLLSSLRGDKHEQ